ncbi:flagellar FliJ protein [Halobacillus dabanensis]|uniref:Flagellar FliJ protein n=1 Tax=Halobacillus dabanensis TaxID=240302 RepID=A0A1I3Y4W1_HALDA|nr:flagellar export protein FliJ [Halobacillus dabanensis]SFK26855.1 flagellar FliJ protein [Halobacillus dabanensis]
MSNIQTFQRIREIRDREKQKSQKAHKEAVDAFEKQAALLYEALRKKEEAVDRFNQTLSERTVEANAFVQHQHYINRLEERIEDLQPVVQKTRLEMQHSQAKLSEAHIEVKKFDTLIENKETKQLNWIKREENRNMDELSMQQYLNFQNR